MSDQLAAASQAMNVPQPIVERSARAWANASGASYEDVISAWAGGGSVSAGTAVAEPEEAPVEEPAAEEEPAPAEEPAAAATAVAAPAQPAVPELQAPVVVEEPEEVVEALPLGARLRLAGRIGAWTGAALGFLGFVLASTWLLNAASVAGEEGAFSPAVEVTTSRFVLGATLLSVAFGIIVATFSRTAAGWADPGARLESRPATTIALGALLGLVLGLGASAVMVSAFAQPVEGVEGVSLLRIMPGIFTVAMGGAFLGWLTAMLVQVVGVPAGIDEADAQEIADVRGRLSAAVSIPVAAAALLALLVLPLGIVFIRSNEMASGGAAVLAVFAAGAILGFATLSASRPSMRISMGEFLVAVAGIATVVLIIFAVIQTRAGPEEEEDAGEETATEETAPEGEAATLNALTII